MRRDRHATVLALVAALGSTGLADAQIAAPAARDSVARGIAYEHGEGVSKDSQLAASLYCKAARAGDSEGQFRLGWMYANGRGVPRDDAIAASLFARAAARGHDYAQRMLRFVGDARDRLPPCMRAASLEEGPLANLPAHKRELGGLAFRLAPSYGIRPQLALAVIATESSFEPTARSPKDARGLMQLMPGTARRFGVANAFDPNENVRGGLAYLQWLLSYYQGRVVLVAAAYNAGEGAVDRYRGMPPYPETRAYVRKILHIFRSDEHPYDPGLTAPSPILAAPPAVLR